MSLKHLALAALAGAGLLLPAAMARPQPASAGWVFPLEVGPCVLSALDASESTPALHKYKFDLSAGCLGVAAHVNGEYNVAQQTAHEEIRYDDSGPPTIDGLVCPGGDPWIHDWPAFIAAWTVTGGIFGPLVSHPICGDGNPPNFPESMLRLGDPDMHLIASTLNDVLTRLAAAQAKAAKQAAAAVLAPNEAEAAKQAAIQAAALWAVTVTGTRASNTIGHGNAASYFGSTPTPAPAPQPVAYHNPTPEAGTGWPQLTISTGGEAVRSLQYLLQQSGAALPVSGVDGKFGPDTSAAVLAFQKAQVPPLTADGIGIVGQQTWLALIVTVQQGSQGPAVQALKSQLQARDRSVMLDANDDIFGPQTDAAVKAYQQAHPPLVVDGQVGPQMWKSLLAGS